jgi:outer membrane protein assembly factor BamB
MRTCSTLLVFLAAWSLRAENWPQWRGPGGNGISGESNLPAEWAETRNVAWKTEIPGRGHSSPVIWGDRIFLTTSIEGAEIPGAKAPVHKQDGEVFRDPDSVGGNLSYQLIVMALDARNGNVLWRHTAYEGGVYDDRHKKNSYATPTPATDGRRVFVSFESQGIFAYDFGGKQIWKASVGKVGTVGIGPASSPVLSDGRIFILCDQEEGEGSFLAAFSARNGALSWKVDRSGQPVNWTTPIVVNTGGRNQLVVTGTKNVISYDPGSGKELWRTRGVEGNAVPSPVAGLGMVFPSSGYPVKRTLGVRMAGPGERVVWQYDKGTSYVPSPILYGDYLYLMTDRGLLTCLQARTGKVLYEGKRVPKPALFSASAIAYDGKLFLSSEEGDTFVIKAGPEHEVIGKNALDEPIYATPSVSHGSVFIRTQQHLYCIRQKPS